MKEERLRERLLHDPIPGEREAERRTWETVHAAYRERIPVRARPHRRRIALALAGATLVLGLLLSPAGAKVRDWINDVVEPGSDNAKPVLRTLPAPGALLVESGRGPWVVRHDGGKRRLGEYGQATWSPSGLFVAVTDGRQLVAVDPLGQERWTHPASARVRDPRWSPSGIRIAYRSDDELHIVAGDNSSAQLLADEVAAVPAAWRPEPSALAMPGVTEVDPTPEHEIAFVQRDRVRLVRADTGEELWRSARFATPVEQLAWSSDGSRLLVLSPDSFVVLDARGRPATKGATGGGARAAAFSPDGKRFALLRTAGGRTELVVLDARGGNPTDGRLLARPGVISDVTWSPNGDWLLAGWRSADEWLFVRASDWRVVPIANISEQFDPGATGDSAFPRVAGWCCVP
jgi:dipeptidyl aminopeptidase/acylaminoacyl peptidase